MKSRHPVCRHVVQDPVPIPSMTHPKPKPKRTKYAGRAQDCMRVSLTPAPGRFQIRYLTGLVTKKTAASRTGVAQRSTTEATAPSRDERKISNRDTKLARREDVTPVEWGPVLPCAPPGTNRLFRIRPLLLPSAGRSSVCYPMAAGASLNLPNVRSRTRVRRGLSMSGTRRSSRPSSNLAGNTTKHRPTPCPGCYQLHTTPSIRPSHRNS